MVSHPVRHRRPARERASILVVCMVLAALGTLGVAAWFSLLDARSQQVEAGLQALQRRTMLMNGKAVAHASLYQTYLHGNTGLANDLVHTIANGNGRATLKPFTGVPLTSTVEGPPSRDGIRPFSSYSTSVAVDLYDGTGETRWTYRLRSHNPVLGGDLLDLHPPLNPSDPAPLVSGNLHIKGRAVLWDAVATDLDNGLRAEEFLLPNSIAGSTSLKSPSGVATLPLNSPHYLRTTGVTSAGPAYRGELELVDPALNPQNAYDLSTSSPVKLTGKAAKSESKGPATKASTTDDPYLLAYVDANPPQAVADELSKYPSLSTGVLMAALNKANPAMTKKHFHQVFDSQVDIPNDALTQMMATIDEADLDTFLDVQITEMNFKNSARFNTNGKGFVQIFVERPELQEVVVEDVTRLRLMGEPNDAKAATAKGHAPLVVFVDNRSGTTLNSIDMHHVNERPLVVVIASSPSAPSMPAVRFKGNYAFPSWRIIFELQNTGVAFDLSGVADAKLIGGIRSNHRVSVTGGTLTLARETEPDRIAPFVSRDAWIETLRN